MMMMRGGGPGGMMGMMGGELNITEEQRNQIREKMEAMRGDMGDMREMSDEQRREAFQKMGEKMREITSSVLTEEQRTRATQMELQMGGVQAATRNSEVAAALKLSEKQIAQLQTLQEENRAAMGKAFEAIREKMQNASTDEERAQLRERVGEYMQNQREKQREKELNVLNDDQKAKFKEMQGEPIDFEAMRQRAQQQRGQGQNGQRTREATGRAAPGQGGPRGNGGPNPFAQ